MKEIIMKNQYILPLTNIQANLEVVGGKGASLAKLAKAGLPVPDGFHITTEAYRQFVDENKIQPGIEAALAPVDVNQPKTLDVASQRIHTLFVEATIPSDLADAIKTAYVSLATDQVSNIPVAVRSSATAEDLPEASFAGQQETYLNIKGADQVLEATRKCWASLWTARAIGYRARQNIGVEGVALAVVVQQLIPADVAGILFTANPINGNRDQMLVSASWGLGESVVGGLVTPDTLTLAKPSGAVVNRETSQKLVQTVRVNGGTQEQPVPPSLQNAPVLNDSQAAELARLGIQIENIYDMPMDIEWTLADGVFAIVQARPVTALPEPPIEWVPPDPKGVYMRGSVVDLMPDPLSPLFVTLGIPTLKEQTEPLGERLTRVKPNMADDYFTAINNYAYMNANIARKTWKWIITGLLPSYPRIFRTMVPFFRDELHPEYQAFVEKNKGKVPSEMTPKELWVGAQEILDAVMYYVCGLMFATMGASAGSEGLLTRAYDKLAKQDGDPHASALLMGWDNIPVRSEKSLYEIAMWAGEQVELKNLLLEKPTTEIANQISPLVGDEMGGPALSEAEVVQGWGEFVSRFQSHVDQFGHMIYQLDFSEPLPLDRPEPMLETIKMYLRGEGANPHERQQTSESIRIQTTETMLKRLRGFKRWAFTKALKWGQSMAEVREDALADIGLGYPMFRAMLLELGQYISDGGIIQQATDIFWLEKEEIDQYVANLESGLNVDNLGGSVAERKAFWKRAKDSTPPPMMPEKKRVMGVKTDVFIPHSAEAQSGDTLKGEATSIGVVTAPACVLHGPEDFGQMQPGDVLVAGTTTPAWTPLFAMASAVVTDIGGPLSHGSIVAREYGIPAVMGTGVATKRIQSGQTISVDGNEGTVTISQNG
jgi:pyruvate,water dikinase